VGCLCLWLCRGSLLIMAVSDDGHIWQWSLAIWTPLVLDPSGRVPITPAVKGTTIGMALRAAVCSPVLLGASSSFYEPLGQRRGTPMAAIRPETPRWSDGGTFVAVAHAAAPSWRPSVSLSV
jgi:hypothetical protein